MRLYTVHVRRPILDPGRDVQLVPEAFSWMAFLFAVPWALWHRLWLLAAALLLVEVGVAALWAELALSPLAEAIGSIGVSLVIGLFANDLRRFFLDRRGYVEAAVVGGDGAADAERRFFDLEPRLAAEALR
jgi:hypothetical protein